MLLICFGLVSQSLFVDLNVTSFVFTVYDIPSHTFKPPQMYTSCTLFDSVHLTFDCFKGFNLFKLQRLLVCRGETLLHEVKPPAPVSLSLS